MICFPLQISFEVLLVSSAQDMHIYVCTSSHKVAVKKIIKQLNHLTILCKCLIKIQPAVFDLFHEQKYGRSEHNRSSTGVQVLLKGTWVSCKEHNLLTDNWEYTLCACVCTTALKEKRTLQRSNIILRTSQNVPVFSWETHN